MRDFTIANLEMACWIARLGSFTAAADRLHTTQPAISARVRDLEESLGLKLFDRHTRGVELTLEGRQFLESAEPLLKQLEELAFTASKSSAGGVVRLGTSSISLEVVARIARFSRNVFPNISYEVELDRAATLLEAVDARKLDLAIVSGPVDPFKFAALSLGFDEMLWVTSPELQSAYAARPLADLFEELPIWCVSHQSFYWATATDSLKANGVQIGRVNELSNSVALARIIAKGGGIGLLSRTAVGVELVNGGLVPVPGLGPCSAIEFRIACRKDCADKSVIAEIMKAAVRESTLRPTAIDAAA